MRFRSSFRRPSSRGGNRNHVHKPTYIIIFVAPRVGAGIETHQTVFPFGVSLVAPRVGAGIETLEYKYFDDGENGRPSSRGGNRNPQVYAVAILPLQVAPVIVAGIEIEECF